MATKRMVSTAKKSAKIVALTALIAGTSNAADKVTQAAVVDMVKTYRGKTITQSGRPFSEYFWDDTIGDYTYDPSDGDCA